MSLSKHVPAAFSSTPTGAKNKRGRAWSKEKDLGFCHHTNLNMSNQLVNDSPIGPEVITFGLRRPTAINNNIGLGSTPRHCMDEHVA